MTSVTSVKEGRKGREAGMPTVVLEMTMAAGTREGKGSHPSSDRQL